MNSMLALVCQRWRDILYQTPRAWHRVTCVARDETRPLTTSFRNLRRAGKSPIVVQIDFRNANHRRGWKDWSVVLARALGGNHWKSLDIVCPDKFFPPSSMMPFISHLAKSEVHPYLVSLTFRAGTKLGTMRSRHRLVLSDAFQRLPSLRSLRIPVQWLKESHVILEQLETLELDCACQSPLVPVYTEILRKCSNLKYLKFPPCDCGIYPTQNRPAFDMVNLNELRMSFILPELLAQARMPNLRTLFIENSRNWDYEIYAGAMQLLNEDRGKSQITKLVVSSTRCSNRTLIWILKRLETLKELQISACSRVGRRFMDALSAPFPRGGWLCPRLETLVIDDPIWPILPSDILLDGLVKARSSATSPSQSSSRTKKHPMLPIPLKLLLVNGDSLVAA